MLPSAKTNVFSRQNININKNEKKRKYDVNCRILQICISPQNPDKNELREAWNVCVFADDKVGKSSVKGGE